MSNNRAMGKLRGVMLQIEHLVDERKRDFRKVMAYIQRVIDDANLCPPAPLRFPFDGPFAERLPKTEEWKLARDFTSSESRLSRTLSSSIITRLFVVQCGLIVIAMHALAVAMLGVNMPSGFCSIRPRFSRC